MRIQLKGGQYYVDQIGVDHPVILPGSMDKQDVARAVMARYGDQAKAEAMKQRHLGLQSGEGGAAGLAPEKAFMLGAGQTGEMFADFLNKPRAVVGPGGISAPDPASVAPYEQRALDRAQMSQFLKQYGGDAAGYGQVAPYFVPPPGAATRPVAGLMSRVLGKVPGVDKAADVLGRSILADATSQGAILGAASDEGTAAEGAAYGAGGGLLGKSISHMLRPVDRFAQDPHLAGMAGSGERLGYTLMPSQRTGSRSLENFEDILENNFFSGGGALKVAEANQANTNRIVAEALGFTDKKYNKVTGDMLSRAKDRLNDRFAKMTKDQVIYLDDDFIDALQKIYDENKQSWVGGKDIERVLDKALSDAVNNGGMITGRQYQDLSSGLTRELTSAFRAPSGKPSQASYGFQVADLKEALDDAAERSIGADYLDNFRKLRQDYKTYKQLLQGRVINEETGDANLNNLANVLRKQDETGYRLNRNSSDLYDAVRFTRAFPGIGMNSRTSMRQSLPSTMAASGMLGMLGYDVYGDDPGMGAAFAVGLPASLAVMGRYYNSPMGRRHFGKGLLPPISDEFRRYLGQKIGAAATGASATGQAPPIPLLAPR